MIGIVVIVFIGLNAILETGLGIMLIGALGLAVAWGSRGRSSWRWRRR
jgi:hypothetical protein